MEVYLNETESRYFGDLFLCCDVEKAGKIPMMKAMELYHSANIQSDIVMEIIALVGIPTTSLHISRGQFYSCLKLIAAYQAGMQLRQEVITSSVSLPLPRFSWRDSPSGMGPNTAASISGAYPSVNGSKAMPPPPVAERKTSLPHGLNDWKMGTSGSSSRQNSGSFQHFQKQPDSEINSDIPTTDSEVDQNESSCGDGAGHVVDSGSSGRETHRHRGSPEAWSTNSDSPTPTNSVAERQWAKETLWQGLLGDEHRQLLGTEEESSDRHSSEDENDADLNSVYQITPEQRDYYYKQFKAVQHDNNGLLSGQIARIFFEKSRIPVEELRHIWQLCDVTRDGALSLAEFTAAMHLVVLRRNNIPLPAVLPSCLHPNILLHSSQNATANLLLQEPPEADLLHLNDDDEEEKTDNTVIVTNTTTQTRVNDKNAMNISTLSSSSQTSAGSRQGNHGSLTSSLPTLTKHRSISNSPVAEPNDTTPNLAVATTLSKVKDRNLWGPVDLPPTQWTKFTESPTSNVSSPGPKPVNFDMQRTAQAVVSDPQILHPVALRVTPVGSGLASSVIAAETVNQDTSDLSNQQQQDGSSKQVSQNSSNIMTAGSNNNISTANVIMHNRELLQNNDLRAIQRPQAKKLPAKNIGALPPPPQRESCVGNTGSASGISNTSYSSAMIPTVSGDSNEVSNSSQHQQTLQNKNDPPPLPPPRPHRHGRSSSLDLNKFKACGPVNQQPEMTAQASFDFQTSTGFADFTHFAVVDAKNISSEQQYSLPPGKSTARAPTATAMAVMPPTRYSLQQTNQRVSAFEVYRKPNTPHNSLSPTAKDSELQKQPRCQTQRNYATQPIQPPPSMPTPFGALGASAIALPPQLVALPNADLFEKRVNDISETLRHVTFKQNNSMGDILQHLREQNNLLLRLCNDLSDELLSVQTRKQELRMKVEALPLTETSVISNIQQQSQLGTRASSTISAPVTANITGGSGSSGVHANV
ncbi:PREDICTED: ralBP1-associated Eps domain-containing protein 1 isoform X1 [Rhagoletis zephyria]|uniref:ralBP1-associated Eps domain-containing protein 1 isoform X1 n=1 Tax=Rhagoletis zephyria TaxID=28612 RepID=UPI000811497B|nr:PREDICTED: ralBP1-associated Eps domain-containing protein 1 isoform X1 [Rhagoletis zephyria]XP_017487871.1 PREDICTED: ralBP1-associated Eps domain-containing protein 1 isoform X1 [Rhagoletis zephyria]